ncbi:MAG: hypothetical protein HYR73_04970 [Candidatus Eisenbacteria bacterium]|nr:hypothetical protein [Candidatus Eisenbacteria bacterium]
MQEPAPSGRREFLKLVGLAGISTTLGAPALAIAQAAKSVAGASPVPPVTAAPADSAKSGLAEKPAGPSEDAKALASIIQRRYGEHLDADQMKEVTDELDSRIQGGQRLRAAKLANGDEPDFTFRA